MTTTLVVLRIGVILVASCVVLSGCGHKAPYRVGVVLGDDGIRGAMLAAEQINASGGIDGHPFELSAEHSTPSTTARLALAAAERLAQDPTILAVVGHTNSSASLVASQVYNARHVVQIAPTSSAPLYTEAGEYSFRLVASDIHQAVFLAEHVLALTPRPRVAVVYVNDDCGRALHGEFTRRLGDARVSPVYDAPYSDGDSLGDLQELAKSLAFARPELLVWIGRAKEFEMITPAIRRALPALNVVASDGLTALTLSRDSTHRLPGVRYVAFLDFAHPDSALRSFRSRYESAGSGNVTHTTVLSYDHFMRQITGRPSGVAAVRPIARVRAQD